MFSRFVCKQLVVDTYYISRDVGARIVSKIKQLLKVTGITVSM